MAEVNEERDEFSELLLENLEHAYRVAFHFTKDRSAAEDLVQGAALSACRARDRFEPGTNFRAWFLRILVNGFYSSCRRARLERRHGTSAPDVEPVEGTMSRIDWAVGEEDPEGRFLDRLDAEVVTRAIHALPTEFRTVAALYFLEDCTYEQMAELLECPIGTIRSRLNRARRRLRSALRQIAEDRGYVVEAPEPAGVPA